ncbi:ankyrin repeat and SOCS box protein 17-like [Pseudophryne corroboree]|uniref:ankyrin repeat and SOCS box protein 17-like n=1 Tax=Pseudophryne corroboree TaxID=495146 RepID=UPI003081EB18
MKVLKDIILKGWPAELNVCPLSIHDYWMYRSDLTVVDVLLTKLISFVDRSESGYFQELKKDFIDICVNMISYMIFKRNNDPALPFKERFGTPAGWCIHLYNGLLCIRKQKLLKLLLQYGVLEEEKNPLDLLTTLLTNQAPDRARQDGSVILVTNEVKICLRLCARVLPSIPVTQLEAKLRNTAPIIPNWQDYISSTSPNNPHQLVRLFKSQIRKQLLLAEHLPDAIPGLEIPRCLQEYLNLEQ